MISNRLYGVAGAPGAPGSAGAVAQNVSGATAPALPASQTVAGTTETVLVNPALASAVALILSIPPGGPLEQQRFEVLLQGYLNHAVSTTVTIKLYSGTSLTVANNTLLGSSGAITAFTGKAPFYASANLIYDSVSGKLQGSVKFMVNNQLVAEVAVSNVVTGLNNANNPVANFVATVTFGSAGANVINVKDFSVNA